MVEGVDTVATSAIVREASGMYPISEEYIGNDNPLYVALPPRREQGHQVLYMVSILCISAAIFLLLRGHHCVLLLESHGKLGGRLRERVLALAETGSFRKCVESGKVLERAVPQGAGGDDLSTASSGSLRGSSEGISSGASSGFEGGPLGGVVGGTEASGLSAPTLDDSQYAQESIVHVSPHAPHAAPHTAFQRIFGRFGLLKKSLCDFGTRQGPLETREGGISAQISTNERQEEKNSITKKSATKKPVLSSKVLLDVPLDRAEHARQLRLLQPSGDVCVDMTEQDLDLLDTAKRYLTRTLNKRSHILNSLQANSARQSLLQGQLGLQRSTSSERYRLLQGRLLKLQEESRLLEHQLWRTRRELKSMIPRQQHMALSLRLVAQRRAAGAYLSSRGAAALSAAILIVEGNGREHAVASSTEEREICKMSAELLQRMQKATSSLTRKMEALDSAPPSGLGTFRTLQMVEKRQQKCRALQREAAAFILQLRLVFMSTSPTRTIKDLEEADRLLRKAVDRCSHLLQHRRHSDSWSSLLSIFRRLRVGNAGTEGIREPSDDGSRSSSLG